MSLGPVVGEWQIGGFGEVQIFIPNAALNARPMPWPLHRLLWRVDTTPDGIRLTAVDRENHERQEGRRAT